MRVSGDLTRVGGGKSVHMMNQHKTSILSA